MATKFIKLIKSERIAAAMLLLAFVVPLTAYGQVQMPQLQPLDKLTENDMSGVKANGFYGKVKTVKFKGEYEYTIKFNQESDKADVESTVSFGKNSRKETVMAKGGDFDGFEFVTDYKFDKYGRIISITGGDIDASKTTYSYEGANAFPNKEKVIVEYEGGEGNVETTITYKYEGFDKEGNWTKRTATTTSISDWNDGNPPAKETKTIKQTAEYTYYDNVAAMATEKTAQETTSSPFSFSYSKEIKPLVEWRTGKDAKYFAILFPIETSGFWFILSVIIAGILLLSNIGGIVLSKTEGASNLPITMITYAFGFLYMLWHFYDGFLTMVVYGLIGLVGILVALSLIRFLFGAFMSEKGIIAVFFVLSLIPLSAVALMWIDIYAVDALIGNIYAFINTVAKPYQIVAAIVEENIVAVRGVIPLASLAVFLPLFIMIRTLKSEKTAIVLQFIFLYASIIAVPLLNMLVFGNDIVPFGWDQFWWKPVFGILYFLMSLAIFVGWYYCIKNCYEYIKYEYNTFFAVLSVIIPAVAAVYGIVPLGIFGVVLAFYLAFWGGSAWLVGNVAADNRVQKSERYNPPKGDALYDAYGVQIKNSGSIVWDSKGNRLEQGATGIWNSSDGKRYRLDSAGNGASQFKEVDY
ncbi:MAG: hypothetical protein LBH32_00910 [Dysgonamonadaceae bacterium]|jgi:hypothetical protein|nr:hypothetical protein [Dysgonamonadaceae bacterium]